MDYKMLIILLALLFIVIMTYRELTMMKHELNSNIEVLIDNVKQETSSSVSKIQSSVTKCLNDVNHISTQNIAQLKKITLLNNQPVLRMTNHYTETDESLHTDMRSNGLTDTKNNIFKNTGSVGDVYYMSESETDYRKKKELKCEVDVECQVQSTNSSSTKTVKELPPLVVEEVVSVVDTQIPLYVNTEKSLAEDNIQLSVENDIDCTNDTLINMLNNEEILYSANVIDNTNTNVDVEVETINDNIGDDIEEDIRSVLTSDFVNDVQEKLFDNPISNVVDDIVEEEVEEEQVEPQIMYTLNGETHVLKDIVDYHLNDIKKIAKEYNLPLTFKNNKGTVAYYKKLDLYEALKNTLKQN